MDPRGAMARVPTPPETKAFFRSFGARIAEFRGKRGLTQTQLARILGCSPQQVASFEKGRRKIPVSSLPALAKAFGITIDELIGHQRGTAKIGRPSKLELQLEQLTKLPRSKQKVVSEMLDGLLKQAS